MDDPEIDSSIDEWVAVTRARIADGSIWEAIEAQPDPDEIVEQWRRASGVESWRESLHDPRDTGRSLP